MDDYQNELVNFFEKYCANKTVVEIGAINGYITEPLAKASPKHLACVEPNEEMLGILRAKKNLADSSIPIDTDLDPVKVNELYQMTANEFYQEPRPAEVVVCFGVIYHLHSPLHFLETMVNGSDPDIVLLEPFLNWNQDQGPIPASKPGDQIRDLEYFYCVEEFDVPGSAQSDAGKKHVRLALNMEGRLFTMAMDMLGYDLLDIHTTENTKLGRPTNSSPIAVFVKRSV